MRKTKTAMAILMVCVMTGVSGITALARVQVTPPTQCNVANCNPLFFSLFSEDKTNAK